MRQGQLGTFAAPHGCIVHDGAGTADTRSAAIALTCGDAGNWNRFGTGRCSSSGLLTVAVGAAQPALWPAVVIRFDQPRRGAQIAGRALDQARGLVLVVEAQPGRNLVPGAQPAHRGRQRPSRGLRGSAQPSQVPGQTPTWCPAIPRPGREPLRQLSPGLTQVSPP